MDRINDFKTELIELLKKYDAQIRIEQPETYVDSATMVVQFNSIWDGNSCIDEYREVNLGTDVLP